MGKFSGTAAIYGAGQVPRNEGIRGRQITMIFQDPGASLNPVRSLGDHLAEVY